MKSNYQSTDERLLVKYKIMWSKCKGCLAIFSFLANNESVGIKLVNGKVSNITHYCDSETSFQATH